MGGTLLTKGMAEIGIKKDGLITTSFRNKVTMKNIAASYCG
jgi:hypothetical protein